MLRVSDLVKLYAQISRQEDVHRASDKKGPVVQSIVIYWSRVQGFDRLLVPIKSSVLALLSQMDSSILVTCIWKSQWLEKVIIYALMSG